MGNKYLTLFLAFLVTSTSWSADVAIPDFREFPVHEFAYKTTLPEPFGEVIVTVTEEVEVELDREVKSFVIQTMGRTHVVKAEDAGRIKYLSEANFAVQNSQTNADGTISGFSVTFEYGVPIRVKLGEGVPGCGSPCYASVKSIIRLKVDRDGNVEISTSNQSDVFTSP